VGACRALRIGAGGAPQASHLKEATVAQDYDAVINIEVVRKGDFYMAYSKEVPGNHAAGNSLAEVLQRFAVGAAALLEVTIDDAERGTQTPKGLKQMQALAKALNT
jgi:predicted RNase H-like HicB family nuclease